MPQESIKGMTRIVYLTLFLALFGTLASADWDEDERCKDRRRAFAPNEPDMTFFDDDRFEMGEKDPKEPNMTFSDEEHFEMGEKVVTNSHDVIMQSGKASSNIRGSATPAYRKLQGFTTMLKMYWKLGYCWQDEYERERTWCMGCEGSTCQEDDFLWLKRCQEDDLEQQFVLEMVENEEKTMMKIKPSTDTDLCWTRTGDNAHTLQKCGNDFLDASGRDKQAIIVDFDTEEDCEGDECFELHPNGRSEPDDCEDACPQCLNIHHHPKHYEVIRAERCEIGRDYKTTLWELYGSEGTLMNLFASSFESAMPSDTSASSTTEPLGFVPGVDYGIASSAPSSEPSQMPSDTSASSTTEPFGFVPGVDYGIASSAPSSEPSQMDLLEASLETAEPPDSPAPSTTPPLNSDEEFKGSPPTPPPVTFGATCLIGITISCTADGVDCKSYQPPADRGDRCLYESTYTYMFENKGTLNAFDITEAMSQLTGKASTDLIGFVVPTLLQPGQSTTILETHRMDYCQTIEVSATANAKATSTGGDGSTCFAESSYTFIPAQGPIRRVLRVN